jgi:putative Mg2+ transporter-C (MgtC) family protein
MEPLAVSEIVIRVGVALLLGALVGIERERKNRPAGFRTMILISLGSCGFVLIGHETMAHLSQHALASLPPNAPAPGQAEISRVLQGLIGGIGFLGAGAVIQNKKAVRGITTAAAVWVVAALGAASGLGLYAIAGVLGGATLFTLVILELFENRFFPDPDDGHGWPHKPKHHHHDDDHPHDHRDHRDHDSRDLNRPQLQPQPQLQPPPPDRPFSPRPRGSGLQQPLPTTP